MRIAPRPSAPPAPKAEKAAERTGTKESPPALDHFSPTTVGEAGFEALIAQGARLIAPDRETQIALLSSRLNELKKERRMLAARVESLQAAGPSPQLDSARASLAAVDSEIADVTQKIAALDEPPKHVELSAQLLRNKPIIG